jgi:16S rRNA (adenine1518-N6/adenine1519-N6)-dimethyltransferase
MTPSPPPPLKRLGQHFLTDPNIIRKILSLAAVRPEETVMEIGPGRGALTGPLCRAAKHVLAVELDPKLVAYLTETLVEFGNLELRQSDALTFPFETLPPGTVVVANLPYYVSTPLLCRLLEEEERFDRLILMLQTEVARRLAAPPGGKEYGVLSVLAQCRTEVALAFSVSPRCFRPSPEVGSSVVRLARRPAPLVPPEQSDRFAKIVRAAFAHRRKTLANSLGLEGLRAERVAQALSEAGIEPRRRAETLSPAEFVALAASLTKPP